MGAAADKGWGGVENTSPMEGPAQITEAANFLAALIDASVATAADLPTSGNWLGRQFWVIAERRLYTWTTTGSSTTGWYATAGADLTSAISSPGSGVTIVSPASYLRRSTTGMVEGYAQISRSTALGGITTGDVFGRITDAAFRPAVTRLYSVAITGASTVSAFIRIETNGDIRFFQDTSLPTDPTTIAGPFRYPAAS